MVQITSFEKSGTSSAVSFIETQQVKEGVECDIYRFDDDTSRDLAIVRVSKGYKTPLQLVIKGDCTLEGFISGVGTLTVVNHDSVTKKYVFKADKLGTQVEVKVGETMQWEAHEDLTFYEICEPPYEDGRFQNLA